MNTTNIDAAKGTGRRRLLSTGISRSGSALRRPARALRLLGLAGVCVLAWAPAIHGQSWSELKKEMTGESPSRTEAEPEEPAAEPESRSGSMQEQTAAGQRELSREVARGDIVLHIEWAGGRDSRPLDGVLADLVGFEAGDVVVPDELVSLTVVSGGDGGTALPWSEAWSLLAGVLVDRQLMDPTLPGTEVHHVDTDGGTVQVPQAFVTSTRIASLGLLERLLRDRGVRRKLYAEAALRAVTLDEAKRYDEALGAALSSSQLVAPALLGATDAAAAAGMDLYTQLRMISGVQAAARAAAPAGDVAATVRDQVSRSGLGRSARALGVLAYGVGLVEGFADAQARNRLLAEAASDVLVILGLENAQRLLAAAGGDPAMIGGLSDAAEELTEMSRSRLAQYAAAGRDALADSAVPTLGLLAAGSVGSGGLALVLQQAAELGEELSDYVGAVLTVSAMTTMGEEVRHRTESLISGDRIGRTGAADYAVRELMGLQRRLAAEATASVYSMLWRDRWSGTTSLGRLGRAVGLTLAEWLTGDEHTEEAFEAEVKWRVGQVRNAAVFNTHLPDTLADLRRLYVGPVDEPEEDRPARQALRAGETRVFDGIEFVWVPAGEFRMGSTRPEADDDEQPVTQVRISRGFWLGEYEVTQAEWQTVMGTNPSWFDECGPSCPVEQVSWHDAQEFIGTLNARGGGNRYRLPSEAEWEYAARAGTETDTYAGDLSILGIWNAPVLDGIAWYGGNSGVNYSKAEDCSGKGEESQFQTDRCGTHPVGEKAPNGWGLHDMLGNVAEWVQDWDDGAYPGGTVTDPGGPASASSTGEHRAVRGGDWSDAAQSTRASNRRGIPGDYPLHYLGFRLLRIADGGPQPAGAQAELDIGNDPGRAEMDLHLIAQGQAGLVRIGDDVQSVYERYPENQVRLVDLQMEGLPTPALAITVPGSGIARGIVAQLGVGEDGMVVTRIHVADPVLKTREGIGVGSSFADLRSTYEIQGLRFGEGGPFAMVESLDARFELDQSGSRIDLSQVADPNDVPGDVRIDPIVLLRR